MTATVKIGLSVLLAAVANHVMRLACSFHVIAEELKDITSVLREVTGE